MSSMSPSFVLRIWSTYAGTAEPDDFTRRFGALCHCIASPVRAQSTRSLNGVPLSRGGSREMFFESHTAMSVLAVNSVTYTTCYQVLCGHW